MPKERPDKRLLTDQGRKLMHQLRDFYAVELNEREFVKLLQADPTIIGTCFCCGAVGEWLTHGMWCRMCIRGTYVLRGPA